MSTTQAAKELTFGEKAVGLTFNHAEGELNQKVHTAKAAFAAVIDSIGDPSLEVTRPSWMYSVLRTAAINACIAAQMAVVKWLTWKD
mgnify:CR=1 FL=1